MQSLHHRHGMALRAGSRPPASASRLITARPHRSRHVVVVRAEASAAAPGLWEKLTTFFTPRQSQPESPEIAARKRLRQASSELLSLLTSSDSTAELPRVNELLDELIEAGDAGQPFDESLIGGGPWVVRFTRGPPFLWSSFWTSSKQLNSRNTASQAFDPDLRSALNRVEVFGPKVFVSAGGTYEPVDDSEVTPKAIRANISSGRLVAWGLELPLPIAGSGLFEVVYIDEGGLRVFRSSGRYAVQVRADVLPAEEEEEEEA